MYTQLWRDFKIRITVGRSVSQSVSPDTYSEQTEHVLAVVQLSSLFNIHVSQMSLMIFKRDEQR